MGRIGIGEVLVVAIVALILFGPKKLPEIGTALGDAIRKFKQASKGIETTVKESLEDNKDKG